MSPEEVFNKVGAYPEHVGDFLDLVRHRTKIKMAPITGINAWFEPPEVVLTVLLEVPERDDPSLTANLTFTFKCKHLELIDAEDRFEFLRSGLKKALGHELDESLYIDDERMFDPHE